MSTVGTHRPLRLFLVAGEHSGDLLGGKLMAALEARQPGGYVWSGVGAEAMAAQGLASIYPMADVAVMGPLSILGRLPRIVRRVYETVDAALAFEPDAAVIIDAPEFTHPIAKRIRKRRPDIPVIDYVSPSVWAWRPGRARRMRRYVDHVMALLPFEPEVHRRLGGPPCTYTGHPMIERMPWIAALDPAPLAARIGLRAGEHVLVILPGSRMSEVSRLMQPFGETVGRLHAAGHRLRAVIPVMPHVRERVAAAAATWPVQPLLIDGEEDKFRAFKLARAALAASGTVTLELAIAGTPMVVAYKVDRVAIQLRHLVKVHSIVLANLVAGVNAFPEYIQEQCNPETLAAALEPLFGDTPARAAQMAALSAIPARLMLPSGSPSEAAADIVLRCARHGKTG